MAIARLVGGIVALGVLTIGVPAEAQDVTPSGTEAARSYAATPQQQPAATCSGLGCLFHWHLEAQETPALPSRAAPVEGAGPARARAGTLVRTVTIAADPLEVARLKRLAAALPKQKIRIVEVRGLHSRPKTDFAVAASLAPRIEEDKTRLFTEQMHIVAGGSVHSLADLNGKVVSFGPDQSPGQAAARKAFEALHVEVKETPLDLDNALDGLATGDVDAVVVLAPQPVARLQAIAAPGVHLISWPENGALPEGATAATIGSGAYPHLVTSGESVRTLGIDATLEANAHGAKDGAGRSFLKALSDNSDALSKRGFDLLRADAEPRHAAHLASARAE